MAKTRQQPAAEEDEADIVSEPDNKPGPDKSASEPARNGDAEGARGARASAATATDEPLLQKYETIVRIWPIDSLTILVRRLTGTPAEWTVAGQPRTAAELYAAIKVLHGRHEDATYEVTIRDSTINRNRGAGRITLPDTREELPTQPQPGQPSMNPYSPYPPGYPQQPYAQPGYAPQQPPPAAGVAGMDAQAFMAFQRQQFDMWQSAQRGPPPGQPQAPQPAPPPVAAPPQAQPSVVGMDYSAFMALQQQQFEMWQQAQRVGQPPLQPAPVPVAAAPQQPQPATPIPGMFNVPGFGYVPLAKLMQALGVVEGGHPAVQPQQPQQPVVQVPEGMFHVPGFGFVPAEKLFQVLSGNPPGPPQYRGPGPGYRGRPGYGGYPPPGGYPPDGQHPPYDPRYGQPPQQPPPPKSMREQFEEVGSFMSLATEFAERFGTRGTEAPAAPEAPPEDDSPVKVIETGPAKIVINKKDGSARFWETMVSNSPGIFKWVAEQGEAIQKAGREREAAKQQRPPLPPGYVEVGPGYQPPPGFVAVPEMPPPQQHMLPPQAPPAQQPLPPPPAQMPPPLTPQQPAAPQRRTWDIPGVTR